MRFRITSFQHHSIYGSMTNVFVVACLFVFAKHRIEKQSDFLKKAIQHWQYPALKTHTIPPAIVLDLQSGFLLFFGYSAHMCIYLKMYEKKDIWCIFTHTLKFGGKCKYYIMYTRRKMADFYVLKAKKVLKVRSNSFDDGFVSCCQCYCSIRAQCTVWKYFFLAAGKI